MRPIDFVRCTEFPCSDVRHDGYSIPAIEINPEQVRMLLISEAAAADPADNYYTGGNPLFAQTTVQAFRDAGAEVDSIEDILALGVYLTTAVKCSKTSYSLQGETIKACSLLLEQELRLFPDVDVLLLMGDVAIGALNAIARRQGVGRVVPAGSTYKLRGVEYTYRGKRVFPSYLQAGPGYFIEKSKRRMIAEDIRAGLALAGARPAIQ